MRAFSPAPAAWCEMAGERIKVLEAETAEGSAAPGTLLDDRLTIACGRGALRLLRVQRPGKAVMDSAILPAGLSPSGRRGLAVMGLP